jgi:hypothetical protein
MPVQVHSNKTKHQNHIAFSEQNEATKKGFHLPLPATELFNMKNSSARTGLSFTHSFIFFSYQLIVFLELFVRFFVSPFILTKYY